jgi:hypothetical protein
MVSHIQELMWKCRDERDVDKKIELYNRIRKVLPHSRKLLSMVTDDYINSALDEI